MREVKRGNPTAAITLQVINLFNLSLPIQFLSIFHFHFAGDLFNLYLSPVPTSQSHPSIHPIPCVLFQYDKLYVDNKCYVWNDLQVSVGF